MSNVNQTKQTWEIVTIHSDNSENVRMTFKGTQAQAEIFHKMMYDVQRTQLRSAQILDLDNIELEADSDQLIFKGMKGEKLVELAVCDEEFFVWDEDCDDIIEELKIEHEELLRFPSFVPLAICSECQGSGMTTEINCSMGSASVCCGGCERAIECECGDVIYNFIED